MATSELTARADKAFSFAQETAKQQITLSTGVLALTLTFLKDFAETGTPRTLLEISWIFYIVSVVFGVMTLMTLTGSIERPSRPDEDTIYSGNITTCAALQAVAFVIALALTVWFGICAT